MELTIDIEGMTAAAVAGALAPEKLQPIIEANVGKAVKEAIESQCNYSSPFKNSLEAAMKERMPATVASMGLYGDFVMKAVVAQLNALQMETAANAVKPMLDRITKPLPAEMKIGELLKLVFEDFNGITEIYKENNEKPTFIVRNKYPGDRILGDYMQVSIDPEDHKSAESCRYRLEFSGDGKCSRLCIDDEDVKNKLIIGHGRYGVERMLLQLYTQQVSVVFDETDFDGEFEYSNPDNY